MKTFRQLVASERPLVLPGAHDAISARLIKRTGFKAYFIGGFPLVGARFGVPDIGLLALGEIGSGIRDVMSACDLPVLVDCDNGYGDVKTVVHAINFYERLGAQAVFPEALRTYRRKATDESGANGGEHPRSGGESCQLRHFHHRAN
jgi:2-methylisocitrate lyase-like PEP mutase family enzyme